MNVDRPQPAVFWKVVAALLPESTDTALAGRVAELQQHSPWSDIIHDRSDELSGLFVLCEQAGDLPVAAQWSMKIPGRTALLGLPTSLEWTDEGKRVQAGAAAPPPTQVSALLAATDEWLSRQDLELAQVAITTPEEPDTRSGSAQTQTGSWTQAFQNYGFLPLVELVYVYLPSDFVAPGLLQKSAPDVGQPSRTGPSQIGPSRIGPSPDAVASFSMEIVPPVPANLSRWSSVLESTYQDSFDCPAMNGRRTTAQAITGYQHTGTYLEAGWWILRSTAPPGDASQPANDFNNTEDVGCCIVADHPAENYLELVYFGLAPAARGQAWGLRLLQQLQQFALQQQRERIVAAVDRQNLPALRSYLAAGFQALGQRLILAKFFD